VKKRKGEKVKKQVEFIRQTFSLFHFSTFSLSVAADKIKAASDKCGFGFKASENVNKTRGKSRESLFKCLPCAGLTCFLPLFIESFIRSLIPEFCKNNLKSLE
jgi:hypothetical protein